MNPTQSPLDPEYSQLIAACDACDQACLAILGRSSWWLTLHPLTTLRLRRTMLDRRAEMIAARDRYYARLTRFYADIGQVRP